MLVTSIYPFPGLTSAAGLRPGFELYSTIRFWSCVSRGGCGHHCVSTALEPGRLSSNPTHTALQLHELSFLRQNKVENPLGIVIPPSSHPQSYSKD